MNIEVLSHDEPATQTPEEICGNAEQRTVSEDDSSTAPNTPDAVLRRICRRSDFPAMSAAINAINREAFSDTSHIQHLSSAILKDFALTNKILRVANSALYRRCGAGTISTISRGIVVLGFDTILQLALSMMLLEHMRNLQHAVALIEDFVHAAMSGVIV